MSSISPYRWITIILIVLLVASVGFLGWALYSTRKSPERYSSVSGVIAKTPMPGPPEFYCPLDGSPLRSANEAKRRPVMAQVDNAPGARNQSGLSQADIVYEAMAEGDVTRFAAIFACHDADVIGPIRSARLINIELVPEYKALLSNSGASKGTGVVLEAHLEIANINHQNYPDAYWRADDRAAPHDLMTSTNRIREAATGVGLPDTVDIAPLTFKDDEPKPAITSITIPYSGAVLDSYRYDAATNSWLRFLNDEPHIDTLTDTQIAPKNVIIQYVSITESGIEEDVGGNMGLEFGLKGSGKALIFRDGQMINATWTRTAPDQITTYSDSAGKPVALNRGLTFIQLVPPEFQASWG